MQINPVKLPELDEELKKRKKELLNELNDSSIEPNNQNEIIGELFYESMKSFFDFGVALANNLSHEYAEED